MPFADHGGLVAGGLEELGDGFTLWVQGVVEGVDAVLVTVLTGEDGGAGGGADGVGHEAVGEAGSLGGKAVDVGCAVDAAAVGGDGVGGVVVGHDEQDVGAGGGLGQRVGGGCCSGCCSGSGCGSGCGEEGTAGQHVWSVSDAEDRLRPHDGDYKAVWMGGFCVLGWLDAMLSAIL